MATAEPGPHGLSESTAASEPAEMAGDGGDRQNPRTSAVPHVRKVASQRSGPLASVLALFFQGLSMIRPVMATPTTTTLRPAKLMSASVS